MALSNVDASRFTLREKLTLSDWTEMAEIARQEAQKAGASQVPVTREGSRFDSHSASIVQVESGKLLPWLLLSTLLSAASIMGSVWALYESSRAAVETRLLEQQMMDTNALLVREGLRVPSDHSNGPSGNIQYERRR